MTFPVEVWVHQISEWLTIPERRALCATCRQLHQNKRIIETIHIQSGSHRRYTTSTEWKTQLMRLLWDSAHPSTIQWMLWHSGHPTVPQDLDSIFMTHTFVSRDSLDVQFATEQFIEAGLTPASDVDTLSFVNQMMLYDALTYTDPCFLKTRLFVTLMEQIVGAFLHCAHTVDNLPWLQNHLQDGPPRVARVMAAIVHRARAKLQNPVSAHFEWVCVELRAYVQCL